MKRLNHFAIIIFYPFRSWCSSVLSVKNILNSHHNWRTFYMYCLQVHQWVFHACGDQLWDQPWPNNVPFYNQITDWWKSSQSAVSWWWPWGLESSPPLLQHASVDESEARAVIHSPSPTTHCPSVEDPNHNGSCSRGKMITRLLCHPFWVKHFITLHTAENTLYGNGANGNVCYSDFEYSSAFWWKMFSKLCVLSKQLYRNIPFQCQVLRNQF